MPHLGNILSHSFSHLPLIPSFHQLLSRNFSGHSGWAERGTFSEKGCSGHLVSLVIFTLHLVDLLICLHILGIQLSKMPLNLHLRHDRNLGKHCIGLILSYHGAQQDIQQMFVKWIIYTIISWSQNHTSTWYSISERLSNMLRVTEELWGRASCRTPVVWLQSPHSSIGPSINA